ncbi:tyrosyl-tRNA synthetase [Aquipluma nitroreducens]|uniref:Tyrosine--tRNA ligase n=1 Tax=Aquipluma nitroreducens TaxID=2010828 RepID=A0A5K7SAL5_9BACT|nr:tyrosine--tRNA ligase [Aquipluma nitroreducens]BBE18334.1 tyrosyl-tRNA synthetase [Aquipluma nitroreducens]
MNFVDELQWRGMIHDMMPGTKEQLDKELTSAYVGIDPTADSLHIGHLVGVMMLKHFQIAGHKPIALVGGATGMIGDPSGKSQERNLLDEPTLRHNQECIKKQLARFLDFESDAPNAAEMVNNYDWMKDFSFLNFIRDIGKHITVNYMMSKDSVKKRLDSDSGAGMSFTEFTYQLVQGTDFLHLYQEKNTKLQMGGSDQWGNITTGTELIRRKTGGEAFALTCPLIKKADGTKFGKTESGNVWLDRKLTSPYKFYQFWLNTSDEDAERYIKIFTLLSKEDVAELTLKHAEAPHLRLLQKRLAEEVTVMVHSREDYDLAVEASQILFGQGTAELLNKLDEETFLSVFDGVPQFKLSAKELGEGIKVVDLLAEKAMVFPSKGELRRTIQGGGLSINKDKVTDAELLINSGFLIGGKYILIQKGKKNYFLLIAE